MEFELGTIIAERSLEAIDNNGQSLSVEIKLGSPEKFPDASDIFVPYQIQSPGTLRLWYAAGVDGFQALRLAMKMIVVDIETLERDQELKVIWGKDLV